MNRIHYLNEAHMKWGKIAVIVAVSIVALVMVILITVLLITRSAANADQYSISGETIPSIKSVVGKRNISGTSAEIENGISRKEYTYSGVNDITDDLLKYINYLAINEGFTTTQDYDLTKPTGKVQLGKQSKEEGKIILLSIDFYLGGYKVMIEKGVGTITPK